MRRWVALWMMGLLVLAGCSRGGSAPAAKAGAGVGAKAEPKAEAAKVEMSEFGFAWGSYSLRVPGAAYVTAGEGNTDKLVVSSGVKTVSKLTLHKDGTYVWDSAWDGKVYKGTWQKQDDEAYPILLLKGQEGKDWNLGPGEGAGKGEILLFDGVYMSYAGDLLK